MPKVYATDFNEFEVYDTKPSGFPSDEIELTDAELVRLRAAEAEIVACHEIIRDRLGGTVSGPQGASADLSRGATGATGAGLAWYCATDQRNAIELDEEPAAPLRDCTVPHRTIGGKGVVGRIK